MFNHIVEYITVLLYFDPLVLSHSFNVNNHVPTSVVHVPDLTACD